MSDQPEAQRPPPFLRTVGLADPTTSIPGLSGATRGDFWRWAYSDLTANAVRGVFAEYLVACALDARDARGPSGTRTTCSTEERIASR